MAYEQVEVARDVSAIAIPSGAEVTLSAGAQVTITQQLGGSITVMTSNHHLVRVDENDADALGVTAVKKEEKVDDRPLKEQVWDVLKATYDPEIPVNIVELGLVYKCDLNESDINAGQTDVDIDMTLTAPGCGMGDVLAADIRRKVTGLRGVNRVDVNVVLDPPWDQSMMSEAARLQLGMDM